MKKVNLIFAAFILLFAAAACNSHSSKGKDDKSSAKLTFKNATEYNDFIISEQGKIINTVLSLAAVMGTGKSDDVNAKYKLFGDQTKKSLDTVKMMDAFNGNTGFRDEAVKLFDFYYGIYQNEYKEMINILLKQPDKITDQDRTRLSDIQVAITKKETVRDSCFALAQNKFASENNMQIMKNDIQDKIDNMNKKQ